MRAAAALVAGIALAGCAALAPPPGQGPVLSGRIAVQVDAPRQGGPAQSLNAHFELTGDARRGSLALSTGSQAGPGLLRRPSPRRRRQRWGFASSAGRSI